MSKFLVGERKNVWEFGDLGNNHLPISLSLTTVNFAHPFLVSFVSPNVLPINSHLTALTAGSAHADEHTTRNPISSLNTEG